MDTSVQNTTVTDSTTSQALLDAPLTTTQSTSANIGLSDLLGTGSEMELGLIRLRLPVQPRRQDAAMERSCAKHR